MTARRRIVAVLVAATLGLMTLPQAGAATPYTESASAPTFKNCDAMHKKWPYGVAKSRKAARKQVRTGHYKPRVSLAGYRANSSLDADKDGTACEVLK